MTSAYVLIAAVLLLGGMIAALGDSLGSKVGKARLRLFHLRPRQTATVVTVLTGITIAASTLGILFSLSKSLREGLFELDEILKKRREIIIERDLLTKENNQVKRELNRARVQQAEVEDRVEEINQNFQQAQAQLETISKQTKILRSEVSSLQTEKKQLSRQKEELSRQKEVLSRQKEELSQQIGKLQDKLQDRDRQLALREQKIAAQDKTIKEKETILQQKEKSLQELEKRLAYEKEEADKFVQSYQELRRKRIALVREQVLAFAAVRILDPKAATEVIDRLLWQANQLAMKATNPTVEGEVDKRVVRITRAQVQNLVQQLKDGREYVVRILSAGNYVEGEEDVGVFADVVPNQRIFAAGETLATVSFDPATMDREDFRQRLDWLLNASRFRARRAGIMGEIQLEDGSFTSLINFLKEPDQSEEPPEEIKVIASDTTYTVGPLKLRLVAVRNGEIIFRT